MTAGMTIYNDDNKIQIDGTYKNLQLSRKIPLTGTGVTGGRFTDGECLAAVGGTTSQTIDAYCVNTPTGWTCTVNGFVSGMSVYVFTTKVQQSDHGTGLQVFDDNGAIVYDSNNKHPRVMGFGQQNASIPRATKPALAIADDIKVIYSGIGERQWQENRLVTQIINHPAEYGYYETTELRNVWHDPVFGYTGGGYEWIDGTYQYVPPTYGMISAGYYSLENVTVQKWGIVKDPWTEAKSEWVMYYYRQPYSWTEWDVSNFSLRGGNIQKTTISTGKSELNSGPAIESTVWTAAMDMRLTTKGIIVDTRSWLLLDVSDL